MKNVSGAISGLAVLVILVALAVILAQKARKEVGQP